MLSWCVLTDGGYQSHVCPETGLVCGCVIVALGVAGCGAHNSRTASRPAPTRHPTVTAGAPRLNTAPATLAIGARAGAAGGGTAARRFEAAVVTFEKARLRLAPALRRQLRQSGLAMKSGCAQILGGAGSERAFSVGVESTLIQQSAQLIGPYRAFSHTLLALRFGDPVLARAAHDTRSVASYMAHLAREHSDPCQIARDWGRPRAFLETTFVTLTHRWVSRRFRPFQTMQALPSSGSRAPVSGVTVETLGLDLNPMMLN